MGNPNELATQQIPINTSQQRLLTEAATLYNGSRQISAALTEQQIYEALFEQIRLQKPVEVAAFRIDMVNNEPMWACVRANWRPASSPTHPLGLRLYLPEIPQAQLFTSNEPLFIEDVATDPRLTDAERSSLKAALAGAAAILPLTFVGQKLSVLMALFALPHTFTDVTRRYWLALAEQTGVALNNHQLIQKAAYRAIQMETAAEIARAASTLRDLHELLSATVNLICERFDFYYAGVYLADEANNWAELYAGTGTAGKKQRQDNHRLAINDQTIVGWCIYYRQPRIALDVGHNAANFQNPYLPNTRSEMALPLVYHHKAIGAITIHSQEQAAFSREDIIFFQTMADQLANAIINARLFEQVQQELAERKQTEQAILRRNEELAAFNRVATAITSAANPRDRFRAIVKEMVHLFKASRSGIALLNANKDALTIVADFDRTGGHQAEGHTIPLANNLASQQVINTGKSIMVVQPQTNPLTESIQELMSKLSVECLLIVPLMTQGEVVGTLAIDLDEIGREFTTEEMTLAETVAGQISGAIENASLLEQTTLALEERQTAQQALARRERYLAAQLEIQNLLLAHKSHDAPYDLILNILGQVSQANRVYIYTMLPAASMQAEWCATNTFPTIQNAKLQTEYQKTILPRWVETLSQGQVIAGLVTDQPKAEQKTLKARNALAILSLPMIVSDQLFGFIGFENCATLRPWTARETDLLNAAAVAISLWHDRRQAEESLLLALQRTESLYRIGDAMATATDQQETFETVLAEYLRLLHLQPAHGSVILFEHTRGYSRVQALIVDGQPIDSNLSFPAGQDLVGQHLTKEQTPLIVKNVHLHPLTQAGAKFWQQDKNVQSLLFIPLVVRGTVVGAIAVGCVDKNHLFSQSNIEIGQAVADQLAIWLENRKLLSEAQYRSHRLQIAAEISSAATSILDADELINTAVNLIRDQFNFYYVGLFLVDKEREWAVLKAGTGEAGRIQLARNHRLLIGGESMIGWSVAHRTARIALDVGTEAVHFKNPILPDTHSEMALPLISRDNAIGALTVQSTERAAFSDEDITLLQTMADQLANVIANANLFESVTQAQKEAELRLKETLALQQLSQNLAATLQVNELMNIFFAACTHEVGFEYVQLCLVDKQQNRIKAVGGVGLSQANLKKSNHPLDSTDILADIVRTGRTEIITGWDDRFDRANFEAEGHEHWIRVFTPITLRRENIGIVEAGFNKNTQASISNSQTRMLEAFISQTALALDNAKRYEASQRAAKREALIKEITTKVRASTHLDTILQTTVQEVGNAIHSSRAYIHLVTPPANEAADTPQASVINNAASNGAGQNHTGGSTHE